MKTDDLIKRLSDELEPVRRLDSPSRRALKALAAALLCVGSGVAIAGPRPDLTACATRPAFLTEILLILFAAVSAAVSAFILSVPGLEKGRWTRWLPALPVAAWGALLLLRLKKDFAPLDLDTLSAAPGLHCARALLIFCFLPGLVMFAMLRRAAPLKLGWSGSLAALSAVGLAAAGLQFCCLSSDPAHLLCWHFTPMLGLVAVGALLGQWLLRRT
ncbi:MAG: DUF1109 domain-containing protein [Elusimicrobia bacterium]|nr:DUF1109 domain-containing protein [Elusimicrobiota bacterium]